MHFFRKLQIDTICIFLMNGRAASVKPVHIIRSNVYDVIVMKSVVIKNIIFWSA